MTNENNEFDEPEFDTDLGFDDTDNGAKKNNPLLKIGLVAAGVVVVLVGIFMIGGPKDKTATSSAVAQVPVDDNALPGQKEPTPEYRQALVNYNQEMVEQAKDSGTSAMPIPVDPSRQQIKTDLSATAEDPAERFRRVQDEYRIQQDAQMQQQNAQAAQEQAQARQQAVEQMSQAMASYLSTANGSRQPKEMETLSVTYAVEDDREISSGGAGSGNGAQDGTGINAEAQMILPATTIEYGQLMIEANTDAPGPVLAMVATGKLAGGRMVGTFQKTDDYLTIKFTQLVRKDGTSIPVNAIAIDPNTTLPGMVTEIDHKYFERYVIPAAANFISGVGSAIAETQTSTSQSSSSTTTSGNDPDFDEAIAQGISDSFDGVAEALEDNADNVEPMLRIAAGTPLGILFLDPVLDPDSVRAVQAQQAAAAAAAGGTQGVMPGYPNVGALIPTQVPYYAQIIQPVVATPPVSGSAAPATPTVTTGTTTTPTATIPAASSTK